MFKHLITILAVFVLSLNFTKVNAQNGLHTSMYGYSSMSFLSFNQEPKLKLLKFYPVPARESITFEFVSGYNRGLSFEIISQIGNKMLAVNNIVSRFTLNLNVYRRGVYFYVLKDAIGKSIETGKFQVIK